MIGNFLRGLADNSRPGSLADQFRRRRFALLNSLMAAARAEVAASEGSERVLKVLDVGGTPSFWDRMGVGGAADIHIVLINLYEQEVADEQMEAVIGDASDLSRFGDAEFDVVVSNSVIEHLPSLELQGRMAAEVRRVGVRHWVQTPNRRFPLEPHFLFPFFQYLPVSARSWLLRHMDLGWYRRERDEAAATAAVRSVRLMTHAELRAQFPRSRILTERAFGLAKSFVVIGGWDLTTLRSPETHL